VDRIANGDWGRAAPTFDASIRSAGVAGRRGVSGRGDVAGSNRGVGVGRGDRRVVSLAPLCVSHRRVGARIERDVGVGVRRRAAESTRDEHHDGRDREPSLHGVTVK
jgi:hypothetical protein